LADEAIGVVGEGFAVDDGEFGGRETSVEGITRLEDGSDLVDGVRAGE
jgi:hypothetical protein